MAPTRKRKGGKFNVDLSLSNVYNFGKGLLFDPAKTWIVAVMLCLAELVVNMLVIWKVKCKICAYFIFVQQKWFCRIFSFC